MKTIDLFCASPASTAICSSMGNRAIVRSTTKPIDRQIHRLGETPRSSRSSNAAAPCLSQLPFDPSKPFYNSKSSRNSTNKQTDHQISRRKSSADVDDLESPRRSSSRSYLLSDKPFLLDQYHVIKDSERALVSRSPEGFPAFRSFSTRAYENPVYEPSSLTTRSRFADQTQKKLPSDVILSTDRASDLSKSSSAPTNRQVVELRVSIHCKGCEGKLRKHISRMEGVTSFSIDLESKKVRVIGDVTPQSVLTSISKVKNAQFWPSPTSSSSSSSSSSLSPRVSLTT